MKKVFNSRRGRAIILTAGLIFLWRAGYDSHWGIFNTYGSWNLYELLDDSSFVKYLMPALAETAIIIAALAALALAVRWVMRGEAEHVWASLSASEQPTAPVAAPVAPEPDSGDRPWRLKEKLVLGALCVAVIADGYYGLYYQAEQVRRAEAASADDRRAARTAKRELVTQIMRDKQIRNLRDYFAKDPYMCRAMVERHLQESGQEPKSSIDGVVEECVESFRQNGWTNEVYLRHLQRNVLPVGPVR